MALSYHLPINPCGLEGFEPCKVLQVSVCAGRWVRPRRRFEPSQASSGGCVRGGVFKIARGPEGSRGDVFRLGVAGASLGVPRSRRARCVGIEPRSELVEISLIIRRFLVQFSVIFRLISSEFSLNSHVGVNSVSRVRVL